MNTSSPLSVPLRNQSCLRPSDDACSNALGGRKLLSRRATNIRNYEQHELQKEIERLSLQDREAAEQGVKGESLTTKAILNGVENDEGFLKRKIQELDKHIASSSEHPGFAAYQIAKQDNPSYVENKDFLKGFLRAERYKPKPAAARLLLYLEEKRDLFGEEKLTKDIFWEDIGKDGQEYLKRGGLQILEERDKAGRLVVFMRKVSDGSSESFVRTIRKGWFYFMTTLGEVDTEDGRIRGYVAILWRFYGAHHKARPDIVKAVTRIASCPPAKISAYHICRPPSTSHLDIVAGHSFKLLPLIQKFGYLRLVRVHYGTAQECLYQLIAEYGIRDCFPFQKDVNSKVPFTDDRVHHWIAQRKEIEATKKEILGFWSSRRNMSSWLSNAADRWTSNDSRTSERWSFGGPVELPFPNSTRTNSDSFQEFLEDPLFESEELKVGTSTGSREHASETINRSLLGNSIFDSTTSQINPNEIHPSDETLAIANTSRANETIRSGRDIPPKDIKLWQGKSLVRKEGNVWMKKLVDQHFDEYASLKANRRSGYLQGILDKIQEQGQRFWKEKQNGSDRWEAIDANDALKTLMTNFEIERTKRGVGGPTSILGRYIPTEDITFGRGKPFQAHPGNIWFREKVAGFLPEYDKAEKGGKIKLSWHIVGEIKSENRRVWTKLPKNDDDDDDDLWVEADDKATRDKISYTFRGIRRDSESKKEEGDGVGVKRRSSQSPSGIPFPKRLSSV